MKLESHYTPKLGKSLVIYDKGEEIKSPYSNFKGCEFYKKKIRVEFRYRKNNVRAIAEQNNIALNLENFVTKEIYHKYFIDAVSKYTFKSDFSSLKIAKKLIRKSNYKDNLKQKLIAYIMDINKYNFEFAKKKYAPNTIKLYNNKLEELGINPMTTISSDYIEGIYNKILDKSKYYFEEEEE